MDAGFIITEYVGSYRNHMKDPYVHPVWTLKLTVAHMGICRVEGLYGLPGSPKINMWNREMFGRT